MLKRVFFWGIGFCLSVGTIAGISNGSESGRLSLFARIKLHGVDAWLSVPWLWLSVAAALALVLALVVGGSEGWSSRRPGAVLLRFATLALLLALSGRYAWVGVSPWLVPMKALLSGRSLVDRQGGSLGVDARVGGILEQIVSARGMQPSVEDISRASEAPSPVAPEAALHSNGGEEEPRRPRKLEDPNLASASLLINGVPSGSEIFLEGTLLGKAPYVGDIVCRKGKPVVVDVVPPSGMPFKLLGACQQGIVEPIRRP